MVRMKDLSWKSAQETRKVARKTPPSVERQKPDGRPNIGEEEWNDGLILRACRSRLPAEALGSYSPGSSSATAGKMQTTTQNLVEQELNVEKKKKSCDEEERVEMKKKELRWNFCLVVRYSTVVKLFVVIVKLWSYWVTVNLLSCWVIV